VLGLSSLASYRENEARGGREEEEQRQHLLSVGAPATASAHCKEGPQTPEGGKECVCVWCVRESTAKGASLTAVGRHEHGGDGSAAKRSAGAAGVYLQPAAGSVPGAWS